MPARTLAALGATLAVVTGGLLAACGSDDGGGDSGPAAGAFVAAADAACTDGARAVRALGLEVGVPDGFADGADYEAGRARIAEEVATAVAALDAPPDAATFVENLRAYAEAYREAAVRSAAGDEAGHRVTTARHRRLGGAQVELARELGLGPCARTLPPAAADAVSAVATRVLTGADPARSCRDDVTDGFRRFYADGTADGCTEVLAGLSRDGATLEIRDVNGVDRVIAGVVTDIATVAGASPRRVLYDLVWDDGAAAWRVDSGSEPGGG